METMAVVVLGALIAVIKGFLIILWKVTNNRMKEMRANTIVDIEHNKAILATKMERISGEVDGLRLGFSGLVDRLKEEVLSKQDKFSDTTRAEIDELTEKVNELEIESSRLMSTLSTTFVFKDTCAKDHDNLIRYIQRLEDRFNSRTNGAGST